MDQQTHKEIHKELHASLAELLSDFVNAEKGGADNTIQDLFNWSREQTQHPDHEG